MDIRTTQHREETTGLNATLKSLRTTFAALNSTLSTADLRESVSIMESERTQILERLTALRSGTIQPVSKEEKEKVDRDFKMWESIAAHRKTIKEDMWAQISEGMPSSTEAAALKEDLGLDD
jgi:26S proteasome regulatory subunit (ATPase 3-interacting protein)